jgi:apolipoprotein D and lipocalin family protein
MTSKVKNRVLLCVLLLMSACTGTPSGVLPVTGFTLDKYLGEWYEIARLDHSFERGMQSVTARYSLREDGGITVLNRGYDRHTQEWTEAEGKAYFVSESSIGHLKVSFFGPFYGSYVIFELDKRDYQYAFVAGMNTDYLWLLSRTPTVSESLLNHFVQRSNDLGFDTDQLILVEQLVQPDNEGSH